MCIYITATIPVSIDRALLQDVASKYNLAFEPAHNEYIKRQLDRNDMYLKGANPWCDCKTGLGSAELLNKRPSQSELEKMGKVQEKQFLEWIDERNEGLTEDANKWKDFIIELLSKEEVNKFGILIHFYGSGLGVDGEEFKIKRFEQVDMGSISFDFLISMEHDVLYELIKPM